MRKTYWPISFYALYFGHQNKVTLIQNINMTNKAKNRLVDKNYFFLFLLIPCFHKILFILNMKEKTKCMKKTGDKKLQVDIEF